MQFETLGLCFVLLLLALPKQRLPEPAVELLYEAREIKGNPCGI